MNNKNIVNLINKFNEIKKMGFIESVNCFKNGSGITLEKLLGTTGGDFNIPDFYDIEIKALRNNPNASLTLFSARTPGPYIFPMQYISNKYGYPDKDYPNIRVIKGDIYGNKKKKIGKYYYFKLNVCEKTQKIYLEVYNHKFKFIENSAYWDYDDLKEMLERKLKYMAVFNVISKRNKERFLYYYNHLDIFSLINFETFISCIKKGIIFICINTGVNKSGYRIGKFVDHGCSFRIERCNLKYLFNKIF